MAPGETAAPNTTPCQGCPFHTATHIARQQDHELVLCACCAEAHDTTDGWIVTALPPTPDTHRTR